VKTIVLKRSRKEAVFAHFATVHLQLAVALHTGQITVFMIAN
jgi:hypothetical protein